MQIFRRQNVLLMVVSMIGGIILLAPLKTPFNYFDEGFAVYNAVRIAAGEIPHRDFWTAYPPGQFYVLSAVFNIFGSSLLISRIYDILCRLIISLLVYLIAERFLNKTLSVFVFFAAVLLLTLPYFYAYAIFPSLVFCFTAILCLLNYYRQNKRRWLLFAGINSGIASIFRHDFGVYVGIALCLTLLLYDAFYNSDGKRNINTSLKTILLLFAGAVIVALPFYGYLVYEVGFSRLWEQLIIYPATTLREFRHVSYLSQIQQSVDQLLSLQIFDLRTIRKLFRISLSLFFPILIYLIALYLIIRNHLKRGAYSTNTIYQVIVIWLFGSMLMHYAVLRSDNIHLLPTSINAFILLAFISSIYFIEPSNIKTRVKQTLLMLLISGIYLYSPVKTMINNVMITSPLECYSGIERAGGVFISRDQERAVEFIQQHTSKNEPIFVGNERHDKIFINDIGFYYLAERPCATFYHILEPGLATTLLVQKSIITDLISRDVKWIVLADMQHPEEDNLSSESSGVYVLDDWIRENYELREQFKRYKIYKRIHL